MLTRDEVLLQLDHERMPTLIAGIAQMIAQSERRASKVLAKNDAEPAAHADLRSFRAEHAENILLFATELRGLFEGCGLTLPPITGAAA
jgi:hypothetical protein